ncbi:MAG: hypothetical protein LIO94_06935 [Clostridiales bacterium]|nr:hypothetical protein [Clostridiales bacterium]
MAKLDEWEGKPLADWCAADPDDKREINYTLHIHCWDGTWQKKQFHSSDKVDFFTMQMIRTSTIRSVELVDDVWYVEIERYVVGAC